MGKYIHTLIVALIMTMGYAYAHEDFYAVYHFGNVKVRIKTGFEYEEINKVAMWGQIAEKMCKELNYSKPVLLDFFHRYGGRGNSIPNFFISYDKVDNKYLGWGGGANQNKSLFWEDSKVVFREIGDFLQDDAIVIRQHASSFEALTTLKLLEYAILNFNQIQSIDSLEIKKMLSASNSDLINNMLNQTIYRPEKNFDYGISYYSQDNRYFVFQKSFFNKQESIITHIDNIYDIKKIGDMAAIVFDSDSSFYYVAQSGAVHFDGSSGGRQNNPSISKRQIIENRGGYKSFRVVGIGDGKIAIIFSYRAEWKEKGEENSDLIWHGEKERILIYLSKADRLIQDFDELLKNNGLSEYFYLQRIQ